MPSEVGCCVQQHAKQRASLLPTPLSHVCSYIVALQVFQYISSILTKAVTKGVHAVLQDAENTIGSIFWQLIMIALQQDPASIVLSLHERDSEDSTGGSSAVLGSSSTRGLHRWVAHIMCHPARSSRL